MSACKSCGTELVEGTTPDGGKIWLDPWVPVYAYDRLNSTAYSAESQENDLMLWVPDPDAPPDDHNRVVSAVVKGRWMVPHALVCKGKI